MHGSTLLALPTAGGTPGSDAGGPFGYARRWRTAGRRQGTVGRRGRALRRFRDRARLHQRRPPRPGGCRTAGRRLFPPSLEPREPVVCAASPLRQKPSGRSTRARYSRPCSAQRPWSPGRN